MKTQSWLWPDHAISKQESRQLREEHNALVNLNAELLEALKSVFGLMDENWLVRNIDNDSEPGFALRQIEPLQKLAKAHSAISHAEQP